MTLSEEDDDRLGLALAWGPGAVRDVVPPTSSASHSSETLSYREHHSRGTEPGASTAANLFRRIHPREAFLVWVWR